MCSFWILAESLRCCRCYSSVHLKLNFLSLARNDAFSVHSGTAAGGSHVQTCVSLTLQHVGECWLWFYSQKQFVFFFNMKSIFFKSVLDYGDISYISSSDFDCKVLTHHDERNSAVGRRRPPDCCYLNVFLHHREEFLPCLFHSSLETVKLSLMLENLHSELDKCDILSSTSI